MKILFDTSTLIAALLDKHPAYDSAYFWLDAVLEGEHEGVVSAHSLAEVYNKLTRIPLGDDFLQLKRAS